MSLEKEIEEFQRKKEKENEFFKEKLAQRLSQETEKIQLQTKESFELERKALQEES
ncbi:hypothetical protein SAMN04487911_11573 [Arenibacter nanhaiticus]|uniref:Uncharacterized protein n=1 Tax=Arenibacter nanhaiticus TaxID=558155 RepID=A0A1M6HY30_9FLAO|nr:hypothetical protein [Arenibacter nanhaiticus]SHJ27017.1 hypothetical protein SAMN04487911_11573 [Arenibacter nanhaiticus]